MDVVPLPQLIADETSKHSLQQAIYAYYAQQMDQWKKDAEACGMCLPALHSFVIAANVPFDTPTTVKAGTCSTAIRVTASGFCTFVMNMNGKPIAGGSGACDYHDTARTLIPPFSCD